VRCGAVQFSAVQCGAVRPSAAVRRAARLLVEEVRANVDDFAVVLVVLVVRVQRAREFELPRHLCRVALFGAARARPRQQAKARPAVRSDRSSPSHAVQLSQTARPLRQRSSFGVPTATWREAIPPR
jgi:hypothetical protein